ncbi:MAG TPA: hypothetical protein VGM17_18710 [Rhizomicrobium sp.]|jgi:hypothetical protein
MELTKVPDNEVVAIARAAVKSVLPRTKLDKIVLGGDDFGFDPGLRITIVLSKGSSVNLTGEQLSRIQQAISAELWKRGDERFPYLRYLTLLEAKQLAS